MAGSTNIVRRSAVTAVAGLAALVCAAEAPKKPKAVAQGGPSFHIKLAELGVPGVSASFLNSGQSMLTVHVLDDKHLMLTFGSRQLVPRVAGDPPEDEDRIVAGEVIEVPSGKVVARADWHMHDHARYIWPIGHGRFVLRIGENLSLLAPLANLAAGNAFARTAIGHQRGRPIAATGGPDGEILSVITELPPPKTEKPKVVIVGTDDSLAPRSTYAIDFFRVKGSGAKESPLQLNGAGVIRASVPVLLPMDADGYLWATEAKSGGNWKVTFNDFNGTTVDAGDVHSSCPPRLVLLSRVEYLAQVCRGDAASPKILAMGLDGHETWEEPFSEFAETPAYGYAPAAGRFAMLRTSTTQVDQAAVGTAVISKTDTNQEVRVYQTESGDMLLRVPMSPVFRVPENFDLAEDGRALAVIHDDEVQVWTLPALTKKDLQDLAEVMKFAPPANEAPVSLRKITEETAAAANPATSDKSAEVAAPVSTTTDAEVAVVSPGAKGNEGDVHPGGPRRRPTLLNPGEKPEFKDKTAPVQ